MTPDGIAITVNGARVRVEATSVHGALRELGYDPNGPGIAVAVNGEIAARAVWRGREIHDGDALEIVGAVQGG